MGWFSARCTGRERVASPRLPATVELDELLAYLRGERIGVDAAGGRNGGPHLGQVLVAVGAGAQAGLQAGPLSAREGALEVVGHQLHRLAAHEGRSPGQQGHPSALPHLSFEHTAETGSAPVEEHPLVALADAQHVAHLGGREALRVAQHHHLALAFGQLVERGPDALDRPLRQGCGPNGDQCSDVQAAAFPAG